MASRFRPGISHPTKRFKACKVRIRSVSTSGEKATKSISLKVPCKTVNIDNSRSSSSNAEDTWLTSTSEYGPNAVFTEEHLHINNQSEHSSTVSKHQIRRVKGYESWKRIRESLLYGRIEEEGFVNEETCACDGVAEVRCIDCGHEQYYCIDCAKKAHEGRNYFHVLERFKVSINCRYFKPYNCSKIHVDVNILTESMIFVHIIRKLFIFIFLTGWLLFAIFSKSYGNCHESPSNLPICPF